MPWAGGAVLALLFLSAIASKLVKSHPRDLIFAIASLLTPLFGIVPSEQICQAFTNQAMLAVIGFWIFTKSLREFSPWKTFAAVALFLASLAAFSAGIAIGVSFFCAGLLLLFIRPFPIGKTFREEFPLPLLLEIFSAYLFFFAIKNSGLAGLSALFLQGSSPWILLALSILAAQIFSFFMPLPVVFAVLFSFFSDSSLSFVAGATIALSLLLNLFFFRRYTSSLFFLTP
jgi:hypothetical protein